MALLKWLFGDGSAKPAAPVHVPEALRHLEERETLRRQAEAAVRASKAREVRAAESAAKEQH